MVRSYSQAANDLFNTSRTGHGIAFEHQQLSIMSPLGYILLASILLEHEKSMITAGDVCYDLSAASRLVPGKVKRRGYFRKSHFEPTSPQVLCIPKTLESSLSTLKDQ